MNRTKLTTIALVLAVIMVSCIPPAPPKKKSTAVKHNYIILLDLSDRLIVQDNQPERDKEIVRYIYGLFEEKVKKDLYIRSRDEIKVVIAPQKGAGLQTDIYENQMYINMSAIKNVFRHAKEAERKEIFNKALDDLYKKAVFSMVPEEYYGADIWKYFYEDLPADYSSDTLTENLLFILTDGYPIVGKNQAKLEPVKRAYPNLHVVMVEASPRDKDMEWDHIMQLWTDWFDSIQIRDYTFIKRIAITKEMEQVKALVGKYR